MSLLKNNAQLKKNGKKPKKGNRPNLLKNKKSCTQKKKGKKKIQVQLNPKKEKEK